MVFENTGIFVIYSYEVIDDLNNNKSTLPKKADT